MTAFLKQLIREFTPFYLTLALLYQYVYTEVADLKGVDEDYMKITERLSGEAYIVSNSETDLLKDNFQHLIEEVRKFKGYYNEYDKLGTLNSLLQSIVGEDLIIDKGSEKDLEGKRVGVEDVDKILVKELFKEEPTVSLSDNVGKGNFLILGVLDSKISEVTLSAPSTYDVIKRGNESRLCYYSDFGYICQ